MPERKIKKKNLNETRRNMCTGNVFRFPDVIFPVFSRVELRVGYGRIPESTAAPKDASDGNRRNRCALSNSFDEKTIIISRRIHRVVYNRFLDARCDFQNIPEMFFYFMRLRMVSTFDFRLNSLRTPAIL